MQLIDGVPVFAATDLVGFLACEHLVGLELAALAGLVERPDRADPELDRIRIRGFEHEARFLADLEAAGRRVTRIDPDAYEGDHADRLRQQAAATIEAIRRGDDVIYQAAFFDGRWRGHADFLLRVERAADEPRNSLGDGSWSYEIADTKLARKTKASALLQICSYVEQLTRIQGVQPEWMHVALGGSARTVDRQRVADYMAYYRMAKRAFEAQVTATTAGGATYPPTNTYPDPVEHCDVCRWALECAIRRRRDDDLSLVAGIARRTSRELKARGLATRRGLAGLQLPCTPRLERTGPDALARVREQARIQVEGEDAGRTTHERLPFGRLADGSIEPDRGLAALPLPSPGDLFLDLEGDPFALDDGVDYLFGILEPGRGAGPRTDGGPGGGAAEPATADPGQFHATWSRDPDGRVTLEAEKRAFEATVDFITARLQQDPDLHVYHYAAYERTALGRLMGRHATREQEVDALLRGGVLVDLFRVVRQGIRASVESYSIKRLEPLYGYTREVDLRDAGSSIVAFETWLETGGEAGSDEETLHRIERYNRDDVVSTRLLRDLLEAQRAEAEAELGAPIPRPVAPSPEPSEELSEEIRRTQELADRLSAGVPADPTRRTDAEHARWLLAQLLSWHRREDKAFWWRYYYLCGLTEEQLVDEREPIGGLEYLGSDGPIGRGSELHRFRFRQQEHDVHEGSELRDPVTRAHTGDAYSIDDVAGILVIKRGPKLSGAPLPTSVIPFLYIDPEAMEKSLFRIGEWVAEHGIDGEGPNIGENPRAGEGPSAEDRRYRTARELLLRRRPRVGQAPGADLRLPGEQPDDAARRLALALDATCLPIQGPPGSGKTYTGARMILDLVAAGKRVGVTANSHKVIGNLLDAVVEAAREEGRGPVRLGQKPGPNEGPTCRHATCYKDNGTLLAAIREREIEVAGATAWAWARPDFAGSVDVLVIDEAGQLSLANAVAVSPAAESLVLLGDPQQLDQPLQGAHPPGAERSALAHVLGNEATMPADRGLFLERTWRLHPSICAYTSEAFYEGKLHPEPGNERQALAGVSPLDGTGLRFLPVQHAGNATDSPEEAAEIARLIRELLAGRPRWTNAKGEVEPVTAEQVLVVAPYNAHVTAIRAALPGANVGTVDKFQGRQAPISIYSMGTSTPEEAPRGMEFLYSLNRLNVATSRARCLTVLVASPELIRVRARSPRPMRLANAHCRLVEVAG